MTIPGSAAVKGFILIVLPKLIGFIRQLLMV